MSKQLQGGDTPNFEPDTSLLMPQMEHRVVFETYGVTVSIDCDDPDLLATVREKASEAFLGRLTFLLDFTGGVDCSFGLSRVDKRRCMLFEDGRKRSGNEIIAHALRFLITLMRVTIAEHARTVVFVHAGVAAVKGKAIVLPANSFAGKTTLVAELIRRGAEYLSDEYAVLDKKGYVHPFPRPLALREGGDRALKFEVSAKSLGGTTAKSPLPVGMVLFCEYEQDAGTELETLTVGNGIKEMIPHSIPIRKNTEFSLKVLNTALENAIILKGVRGEAPKFAEFLLAFIDSDLHWSE